MTDPGDEMDRLLRAGEYPAITREILDSTDDTELDHEITSFIHKQKIQADPEREFEIVSGLSPGMRMVFSTYLVSCEVPNGGFNQFFWNHDARYALLAQEGFELLGIAKLVNLMKRVVAVRALESEELRPFLEEGTLAAFSQSYKHTALNDLDHEFYPCQAELNRARHQYVRSHPEQFIGP